MKQVTSLIYISKEKKSQMLDETLDKLNFIGKNDFFNSSLNDIEITNINKIQNVEKTKNINCIALSQLDNLEKYILYFQKNINSYNLSDDIKLNLQKISQYFTKHNIDISKLDKVLSNVQIRKIKINQEVKNLDLELSSLKKDEITLEKIKLDIKINNLDIDTKSKQNIEIDI